jgi:hypothetical protein
MTLVAVWLDPSETYLLLATDSLLSDGAGTEWKSASKVFRFLPSNAHIAYCGVTEQALLLVVQSIGLISVTDNLRRFGSSDAPGLDARVAAIEAHVRPMWEAYPWRGADGVTLVFGDYDHRLRHFRTFTLDLEDDGSMTRTELPLQAGVPLYFGSGGASPHLPVPGQQATEATVFEGLMRTIEDNAIPSVGGVPQLVRIGPDDHQTVGYVEGNGRRHALGMHVIFGSALSAVDFRNRAYQAVP